MQLIEPSWRYIDEPDGEKILKVIEMAGRICYKSEDKITGESARKRIKSWIKSGHHSVIEHASVGVIIVTDRGVTHELVRHRLCSFSQESTRYCNYSGDKFGNEIKYIDPYSFELTIEDINLLWVIEEHYMKRLEDGLVPQQARYFLPNGLKTEIAVTCNIREWRHIFTLRTSGKAHPDIRGIMKEILRDFKKKIPILFDDILEEDVQ